MAGTAQTVSVLENPLASAGAYGGCWGCAESVSRGWRWQDRGMDGELRPLTEAELMAEVQRRLDRGPVPATEVPRRVREASARIAAGEARPHPRRPR